MRARFLFVSALLSMAAVAPTARALPVLTADDAAALATELAEAQEVQGICYGWIVTVQDSSGGLSGTDQGSSETGPDTPPDPRCVVLIAEIVYTSESSESEDSAAFTVRGPNGSAIQTGLSRLDFSPGSLLSSKDDQNLTSMVEALPLLAAEAGAPAIPAALADPDAPTAEIPTGAPGSDWWRTYRGAVFGYALLLALFGAIAWLVIAKVVLPRRAARQGADPQSPTPHPPHEEAE